MRMSPVDLVLNTRPIGAVLHVLLYDVRSSRCRQDDGVHMDSTNKTRGAKGDRRPGDCAGEEERGVKRTRPGGSDRSRQANASSSASNTGSSSSLPLVYVTLSEIRMFAPSSKKCLYFSFKLYIAKFLPKI